MESTTENDKMLDVDEGPKQPDPAAAKEEEKAAEKPKMIQQQKLYEVMKALTAMKLTKEDQHPGEVYPDIYLGSIGTAYNKEVLT